MVLLSHHTNANRTGGGDGEQLVGRRAADVVQDRIVLRVFDFDVVEDERRVGARAEYLGLGEIADDGSLVNVEQLEGEGARRLVSPPVVDRHE